MKSQKVRKIISFISSFSLLFQTFLPLTLAMPVYADDATDSAIVEVTPTPEITPEVTPEITPEITPTPEITITPEITPEPTEEITPSATPTLGIEITPEPETAVSSATIADPVWVENEDGSVTTFSTVGEETEYQYKDTQAKITFTKLTTPGYITIREFTPDNSDELGIVGKAYDITSDMEDGTFEYNLTLPIPSDSPDNLSVKYAETSDELPNAQTADQQTELGENTITVSGLNHFTVFVIVAYDALPDTDPATSYPSQPFQAQQVYEFGDLIHLGGTSRVLNDVTVTMSDYATYATYESDDRYKNDKENWTHPITLNIYNVVTGTSNTVGTLLGTITQTVTIPWRPEGDETCPMAYGTDRQWKDGTGRCNYGYAFNATFDLSSLNLTVPDDIIVSVAFNTQSYGLNPMVLDGPYNSLNVAVPDNQTVTVGSDDSDSVFLKSTYAGAFVNGSLAGTGLVEDSPWTPNGTLALKITTIDTTPDCNASSFDSFDLGSVNTQGGWTVTGPFDQAVVTNTYGYSSFGCKSLRISDSITSGSFGDQIFANPEINGTGETFATTGSFSLGTRQNHFEAQFDIASTISTEQPGMHVSISPDRGDGSRMSYLNVVDNTDGMDVFFYDVTNPGPIGAATSWKESEIASNLSRTTPHTIKFVMDFVDGPANDLVEIWIDGSLVHTGTSWEDYYRYDNEASAEQSPRIVKTVLFRQSGDANPANSEKGFLFDNYSSSSSIILPDTTAPAVPTLVSPIDGIYRRTSDLNKSDWSTVYDISTPVVYYYQSSRDINFGSLLYDSIALNNSEIMNPGEPEGTYYWRVRACDGIGNCSSWSTPWKINIDNTTPTIPINPSPHNISIPTNNFDFDWDDSIDSSSITYLYQASLNPAQSGGVLTTGLWSSGILPTSMIHSSGASDGIWYWQVIAKDAANNQSPWSDIWNVNIDTVAPTVDLVFPTPSLTATSFQAVFSENVIESEAENPANYFLNNWPGAGGSGDLVGDASIVYDSSSKTATISFTNPGWYISPEQQWGVENIHDPAGNLLVVNPYTEYSTPMVAPTNPGTPSTAPNLTNILTQNWTWTASTDIGGSGVNGYYQRTYNVLGTLYGSWAWLGNVLGTSTNLTDGEWQLQLQAEDNAGNKSSEVSSTTLTVDATTPSKPVITAPANNLMTNVNAITVTWTGGDDQGAYQTGINGYVIRYAFTPLGGGPVNNWSSSIIPGNPKTHSGSYGHGQGTYVIYVKTIDNAGNQSPESDSLTVTYDNTPPSAPILNAPADGFITRGVAFSQTWFPVSGATLYKYESCNTDPGDSNGSCSSFKWDGTYTGTTKNVGAGQPNSHFWWRVKARDAANNWGNWSESRELIIDNNVPVSIIITPTGPGYFNSTISITGNTTDNVGLATVELSSAPYDGSVCGTYSSITVLPATGTSYDWNYDWTPVEGNYCIKAAGTDSAGNIESSAIVENVVYDKTIPEVALSISPSTGDASNGWYKTQPEVTLTATDANMDKIEYQWDSQTGVWSTYSTPFKPSSEGGHILYYQAKDLAGNYSGVGVKNISWDQTDLELAPQNVSADPNPTSGSTSKISWDAAKDNNGIDKYEVKWTLNDSANPLSYSLTVGSDVHEKEIDQLIEGRWTVSVRAFDAAGNSKDSSIDLYVDRTGPIAPTLTLVGTGVGTATLSWTTVADANDYIIWYGNAPGSRLFGARVGNTTSYTVRGLGGGDYYFIVKAVDAAQNQGTESNEVSTGTIVGAPGVEEGTPAEGFTPEVLGTNTEPTPSISPAEVLGSSTDDNGSQWYWWLLILLIPLFFGIRQQLKKE